MVSVIMNTINEEPLLLSRAVESYLRQKNCELIVSTLEDDPAVKFLKKRYPMVRIITMPRKDHPIGQGLKSPKGSFLQLNNALPHIKGDWFTFASGNDYSYPHKLQIEVSKCIKNKKEVCYSSYDYIYDDKPKANIQLFSPYNRERHQTGNFVADCSMVSRRLVDKYLPFKVELNNYAYWDLWLRIYEGEGDVFIYNPIPTWGYLQDRNSMHVNRWADPVKMQEAEIDKQRMLDLHPL